MLRLFVIGIVSAILINCNGKSPEDFTSDKELYEHAMTLYGENSFGDSIPFFESLQNRFPQSPYAVKSALKVGDAYYEKGDYLEAEVAYQSFRSLYPTNEKIPYVLNRLGMSRYEQMPRGSGRDQEHAKRALVYFSELTVRFPKSNEAENAKPIIDKVKRKIDEQDMYVADFYLKQKQYKAALLRLNHLQANSSFSDIRMEALYKLGYAHAKLKDKEKALEYLNKVVQDNEAGAFKSKAKTLIAKLR